MLTLDEILEELTKQTKLSKDELMKKIEEKQEELSGLVSLEGAAHLVARDLGIDLLKRQERTLQLKDIKPDMKRVNLKAKIISITPVREFSKKDGTQGKVRNLVISDGTGQARIPLWDKQVEIADEVNIGDVIELKNVSARQSNFGNMDIVLYKTSMMKKVDEDLPVQPINARRIEIKDAVEGNFEIKGMIVDIFPTTPIFYSCPQCRSKLEKGNFVCQTHGQVEPEKNLIISGVIDDGTGTIRAVFFRDVARDVADIDIKTIEPLEIEEALGLIKERTIGKEFLFKGRIQKNKIFENLELVVNEAREIDVLDEANKLVEELGVNGREGKEEV
jgi:replication factor A1